MLSNGQRVPGFVALQGGFYITDATATATWSSFFPVSGDIAYNGGTLYLQRDMLAANVTGVWSLGSVIGNNYALHLASSASTITLGCAQQLAITAPIGLAPGIEAMGWSNGVVL